MNLALALFPHLAPTSQPAHPHPPPPWAYPPAMGRYRQKILPCLNMRKNQGVANYQLLNQTTVTLTKKPILARVTVKPKAGLRKQVVNLQPDYIQNVSTKTRTRHPVFNVIKGNHLTQKSQPQGHVMVMKSKPQSKPQVNRK